MPRLSIVLKRSVGADVANARSVLLATELANEGEEGGCEDNAKQSHAQHPEQHRCTERLPHLCARRGPYFALAMTCPKISKSERIILRNSSEVLPTGIDLTSLIRLSTVEERMAPATSVLILSRTSGGSLEG